MTESLLTIGEVARYLRQDATTIRRHIQRGAIDPTYVVILPHRVRQSYRIKRQWLENLLQGNTERERTLSLCVCVCHNGKE